MPSYKQQHSREILLPHVFGDGKSKSTEAALCKEALAMWAKLGMDYKKIKCNCVG